MGDLKGALAAHFNFHLPIHRAFPLTLGLLLPMSLFLRNRGGLVNESNHHKKCQLTTIYLYQTSFGTLE